MKNENAATTPEDQTSAPGPLDRKYVGPSQLAKLTPISYKRWEAMRAAKEGPPWRKIGRRVVYEWAKVVEWIEAQPGSGEVGSDR